jgi:precorrin-2 dehydrogenase/sirohydrochlorin ferrochelatase
MKYFPLLLDLRGRSCVVIGGGSAALQKCRILLDAGARITLVSPRILPELADLLRSGAGTHVPRAYQRGDLAGHVLAVVATNDQAVQEAAAHEAEQLGILINVVDNPKRCSFIMPAILSRGDLTIAVSTAGRSPGFSGALRDRLAELLGPEYARAVEVAARLRERWQRQSIPLTERRRRARCLLDEEFLAALRRDDWSLVQRHLEQVEGEPISLAELGVESS